MPYLKKNNDLCICDLKQVFIISVLHRFIFYLKYRYIHYCPQVKEIITAWLAHSAFYLHRSLIKIGVYLRKLWRLPARIFLYVLRRLFRGVVT
ncbi:MAG: hypothetical protein H7844_02300 [Nitrospirae bacterium YQR-1]